MNRLDGAVSGFLSRQFKHESRRSFLSRITRGLFGVAGFSVGAAAAPFLMEALGQTPPSPPGSTVLEWQTCGLNGPTCRGDCAPKKFVEGTTPMQANGLPVDTKGSYYTDNPNMGNEAQTWVLCCDRGYSNWSCCRYMDYCGVRGTDRAAATKADQIAKCGGRVWPELWTIWCGTTRYWTAPMKAAKKYPEEQFLCTDVTCDTVTYTDNRVCKTNCKPALPDTTGEKARACNNNTGNPYTHR